MRFIHQTLLPLNVVNIITLNKAFVMFVKIKK